MRRTILVLAIPFILSMSQAGFAIPDDLNSGENANTTTTESPESSSSKDKPDKEQSKKTDNQNQSANPIQTVSETEKQLEERADSEATQPRQPRPARENGEYDATEKTDPTIDDGDKKTEAVEENQEDDEEGEAKEVSKSPVLRFIENSTATLVKKKMGVPASQKLTDKEIETSIVDWIVEVGVKIGLILILSIVAITLANVLAKSTIKLISKDRQGSELKKRATTISSVFRYLLIGGICATAATMILKELKIDIGPLLAGAGVLTLAAGFGAQSMVKDLISGFFILLEDQIRVGDVVTIADKRGTVEKVTLRMVALRDVRGNVHYIPSGEISVVTNMTKDYSRYLFDIGIAYRENTDDVVKAMKEVDEEIRTEEKFANNIRGNLEVMGVHKFETSSVIIRARIKTNPGKQWQVGREYNRRFKQKFDQLGIELPYPHITVYPGSNKDGSLPRYSVAINEDSGKL